MEDGFMITNTYRKATPPTPPEPPVEPEGSVRFSAVKVLEGKTLEAGEFTFELYEGGTLLQTKKNAANGAISFDTICYTKADVGTHTYTVKEAEGSNDAVTYDTAVYTITVTVADNGTAQLAVTAEGAEGIVFTNVYDDSYEEDEDPNNPHAPYEDEDDEDGPDTPHSPYTGDDRHTAYWLLLSMLSAAGIVLLNSKRREDE